MAGTGSVTLDLKGTTAFKALVDLCVELKADRDDARQVALRLLRVLRVFHAAYHCEDEISLSSELALESLSPALRRLVEE
jgi:hypothetical protein